MDAWSAPHFSRTVSRTNPTGENHPYKINQGRWDYQVFNKLATSERVCICNSSVLQKRHTLLSESVEVGQVCIAQHIAGL